MKVDGIKARAQLLRAVNLAKTEAPLPTDWLAHATALRSPDMPATYTPFVLTALLARAVESTADAFAIKADAGPNAYSTRGLAHNVLVPVAQEHGIDLRTRGAEPLNNQPFFRYDRVDEIARVQDSAALDYLVGVLTRVQSLEEKDILPALAAMLRVGLRSFDGERAPEVVPASSLGQLISAVEEFLTENPEGGLRAQAAVAAALSCTFADVRTGLVNDPSHRIPGDVLVCAKNGEPLLAVEVRAKPIAPADAERFRSRVGTAGIGKAMLVALAAEQGRLEYDEIIDLKTGEPSVLQVLVGPMELLATAAMWSGSSAESFAAVYPRHLAERLLEVGAPRPTVARWARLTFDFRSD